MATKRKTVAKKTSTKKTATKRPPSKFYMVGDYCSPYGDNERVSIALPTKLLVDYCTTAIAAHGEGNSAHAAEKKVRIIEDLVAKQTSKAAARILSYNASYEHDAKAILNAIKRGRGCSTGEGETVSGWGPTRKVARAKYDEMQDDDGFDEMDW